MILLWKAFDAALQIYTFADVDEHPGSLVSLPVRPAVEFRGA